MLDSYHNADLLERPNNDNDNAGEDIENGECFWTFADFGHVGERSRDGSIHATDEVFNSLSHLSAFFLSVLGTVLLIAQASAMGAPWKIVSFSIYGLSLCSLFAASTLHHSIHTTPAWERTFQLWDYLAIFPLIAGTLTPLCLVYFPYTTIGWSFFSVVWVLSIVSMWFTAKFFHKRLPKWVTMTMYITLGWLGAWLGFWLVPVMGVGGISLLIGGGLFYTVGGVIYSTEQPNPVPGLFGFHELWHVFVILGAGTHWFMMYAYVLPWIRPAA
eukprot:Nitzschia sp. Nitz4//scaffold18_size181773//50177//50992//NITZ4_001906-RA/size181773-processed-gene-0.45-mRNA-1//-1//CDS//3329539984//3968//frame0